MHTTSAARLHTGIEVHECVWSLVYCTVQWSKYVYIAGLSLSLLNVLSLFLFRHWCHLRVLLFDCIYDVVVLVVYQTLVYTRVKCVHLHFWCHIVSIPVCATVLQWQMQSGGGPCVHWCHLHMGLSLCGTPRSLWSRTMRKRRMTLHLQRSGRWSGRRCVCRKAYICWSLWSHTVGIFFWCKTIRRCNCLSCYKIFCQLLHYLCQL